MASLFHTILYQPIFNLFVGLYNLIPGHDVGLVIIILTILIRLALFPLTSKSIRAQKATQELQPKMEAVKKQYADDQQKQAAALMALYKENKVNPFSSCLPLLIQLPILIALYWVLRDGLAGNEITTGLYSFVHNPGKINSLSFGFFDLNASKNYVLAVLAGAAQFWQAKMMVAKQPPKEAGAAGKDEGMMAMMNKQMLYFMPFITVMICISLPSGLSLYWLFSTLLTVVQQIYIQREKKDDNEKGNVIEGKILEKEQ